MPGPLEEITTLSTTVAMFNSTEVICIYAGIVIYIGILAYVLKNRE
jgi:hypothetical protein